MIGIYKITNPLNESYIGQSKDISKRFYTHKNNCTNIKLQESIDIYGIENHSFEVLEECSIDKLIERERFFIKEYKNKGTIFNCEHRRKKLTNERFQIRCHPKVIIDVRKYAKEKSEEYDKNTRTAIYRASKD